MLPMLPSPGKHKAEGDPSRPTSEAFHFPRQLLGTNHHKHMKRALCEATILNQSV